VASGYSTERVDTFIGFLELVLWIAVVVVLAAAVTYAVIKLFPAKDESRPDAEPSPTKSR
jgi:hypothetical protein